MNRIEFTKMEGAGNDFIVIDNRTIDLPLDTIVHITPNLCDRRYGIGADGILILNPPNSSDVDYSMIYRNADGSDAGMCGNGGRCLALFASTHGFAPSHSFNVHQNIYKAEVDKHVVSIKFPVTVQTKEIKLMDRTVIQANAATEHIVSFVDKEFLKDEASLVYEGRKIRNLPSLNPPGTNVNFVCVENENRISVQTYERGVENLTLACGTGALASAIASHSWTNSDVEHAQIKVSVKGGDLTASFDFDNASRSYSNLILTGPAHFVFEGSITV